MNLLPSPGTMLDGSHLDEDQFNPSQAMFHLKLL